LDVPHNENNNGEPSQEAEILLEIMAPGGTLGTRCLARLFPYKRL
jgi:hypothetical protein